MSPVNNRSTCSSHLKPLKPPITPYSIAVMFYCIRSATPHTINEIKCAHKMLYCTYNNDSKHLQITPHALPLASHNNQCREGLWAWSQTTRVSVARTSQAQSSDVRDIQCDTDCALCCIMACADTNTLQPQTLQLISGTTILVPSNKPSTLARRDGPLVILAKHTARIDLVSGTRANLASSPQDSHSVQGVWFRDGDEREWLLPMHLAIWPRFDLVQPHQLSMAGRSSA